MKSDIPLKRLTRLRPADLLPLLGAGPAEVIGVETLELPAGKSSLDTVLRLRNQDGEDYLHLIEWQGYNDRLLLWRTLSYLAWLGQNRTERPILATIIYLKPEDDVGDLLHQTPEQAGGWSLKLSCVRLWQQDATAAVTSGAPGLLALAPLMGGATAALVEQAAQTLIRATAQPEQGELLAALGIFAEPLFSTERFIRLVTKERLMSTDLISYLFQDKLAEFEQEKVALEQEKVALEQEKVALEQEKVALEQKAATLEQEKATLCQALQQSIAETLALRYPEAPMRLTRQIQDVNDPIQLQRLFRTVLSAPDLAPIQQLLDQLTAP